MTAALCPIRSVPSPWCLLTGSFIALAVLSAEELKSRPASLENPNPSTAEVWKGAPLGRAFFFWGSTGGKPASPASP